MGVLGWIRARLNRGLNRLGAEIVPIELLYEWQHARVDEPSYHECPVPSDSLSYLKPDNPRLIDLLKRYRHCEPEVTTPLIWTHGYVRSEDITYFRGDNAWLYQLRGRNANILAYALSFYYLQSIDRLGLLQLLREDCSFGNWVFHVADKPISRDLLDSVAEIYFLERHLELGSRKTFSVLDVGAGYGRLAHRMTTALPNITKYLCTDAVAVSTFVSEFYLRFRRSENAQVIPLDEIDHILSAKSVDLAVNIHSFSECRPQAIEWWARLLSKHGIRYLMVVPNACGCNGEHLITKTGYDFLPLLERHGYKPLLKEPKFLDPLVQQYGVHPSWHHLLELRA